MIQEDRKLLLRDLNARLHCGVVVTTANPAVKFGVISGISIKGNISVSTKDADIVFDCTEVKPYLRPMSSMTEEEKVQLSQYACIGEDLNGEFIDEVQRKDCVEYIDWLNKHHFDYRGLIERGLAIEAPEGMYN